MSKTKPTVNVGTKLICISEGPKDKDRYYPHVTVGDEYIITRIDHEGFYFKPNIVTGLHFSVLDSRYAYIHRLGQIFKIKQKPMVIING